MLPRFQSFQLVYRIESPPAGAAAAASLSAAPSRPGKVQTLSIQYPHPKGKAGYARAEWISERPTGSAGAGPIAGESSAKGASAAGWMSSMGRALRDNLPGIRFREGIDEALGLDVPLAVVERALGALESQGYFAPDPSLPPSAVQIATNINGVSQNRPWRTVQELDAIASRVRHEGQVVSHTAPFVSSLVSAPGLPAATSWSGSAAAPGAFLPGGLTAPSGTAPATGAPTLPESTQAVWPVAGGTSAAPWLSAPRFGGGDGSSGAATLAPTGASSPIERLPAI